MNFEALADLLNNILSADYQNGRLSQKFLPGYPDQQGRAQLATSRAYDRTVEQAKAQAAAREMALREQANNQALANYNAERGQPMTLGPSPSPMVPPTARQPLSPPHAGMTGTGARPSFPPHAGMTGARPPAAPMAASPTARPPVAQRVSRAVAGISPQDYFELLKRGQFRMG